MEITAEEKNVLEQIYGRAYGNGYAPNKIEELSELTATEKRFFDKKNFVSPYFSVQTLYKINEKILPMKFNRAVLSLIAAEKSFRTNYCDVGSRVLKVVFSKHSGTYSNHLPEIVFRKFSNLDDEELDDTLTKIMEADRRKTFDLKNGHLFRFSVFQTSDSEFAIIFTALYLIADKFNSKNFFQSLLTGNTYQHFDNTQQTINLEDIKDSVRNYWAGILKDLPPIKTLPYSKKNVGSYNEKVYREKIPADISSDLRGKAQSNKMMLMSILQSAWGFLLQSNEKINDVTFCQLVSGLKNTVGSSMNIIPVRMKSSENVTVENIVKGQFKQMILSQPYSFFDWENLQILTGERGKNFDHFLSFLDFQGNQKTYSQTESESNGKIVAQNSWDYQSMKLGAYFQYANTTLSFTFLYDANSFLSDVGESLAKIYNVVLRQMLVYWNSPFRDFMEKLNEKIVSEFQKTEKPYKEDEKKFIVNFISANPILQGEPLGKIHKFASCAKLARFFEGDRISEEILDKNLAFVVEGKLARSLDTGDGWFNALDIISKHGWINENIFLKKRHSTISAEVLTEQAIILLLPYSNVVSILNQQPDIYKSFMNHILKQMEKYQILWLQS